MDSKPKADSYRIATVATFDYFPFLLVFLGSLFRNVDLSKVSAINILMDECPSDLVDYLKRYSKVDVTILPAKHTFGGTHSEGWQEAVSEKLHFCKNLLTKSADSLLLIDSDILFVKDLPDFQSTTHDIIFTVIDDARERHVRNDGLRIDFIGSAVYFASPSKSLEFLDKWVHKMQELKFEGFRAPYETPALNILLQNELKLASNSYGVISDKIIAADQKYLSETTAIHLKSWGPNSESPVDNFRNRTSKRDWPAALFPPNFMDFNAYELWLLRQYSYIQSDSTTSLSGYPKI